MSKPNARPTRNDPKPRNMNGLMAWNRLVGNDPSRHYVWVSLNAPFFGTEYYEGLGYDIEYWREGCAKPAADGRKDLKELIKGGGPIQRSGHVLMSCPKETREEIEQFGPDGDSGQDLADKIENALIKDDSQVDLMRGIRTRGLRADLSDTTALEPLF